jgi:hypothetical protein
VVAVGWKHSNILGASKNPLAMSGSVVAMQSHNRGICQVIIAHTQSGRAKPEGVGAIKFLTLRNMSGILVW